jgi:hypothetical protein
MRGDVQEKCKIATNLPRFVVHLTAVVVKTGFELRSVTNINEIVSESLTVVYVVNQWSWLENLCQCISLN